VKPLSQRLGEDQFAPLTIETERELADRLRKARTKKQRQAVRDELIMAHVRLVVYIGKGYENRLPHDEIMSIGLLALTQAAERWDPDKGSIYQWARRWITTALTKAVDASRPIRVPEAVANEAALIALRIAEIEATLGRRLTQSERAEVVGNRPTFDTLPTVAKSLDAPLDETYEANDPTRATSLDETIEDEDALDPEDYAVNNDRANRLAQALQELDEIEREIVMIRFGFGDGERATLAVLGKRYGMSAEAMRRIEMSALAKLRHPAMPVDLGGLA